MNFLTESAELSSHHVFDTDSTGRSEWTAISKIPLSKNNLLDKGWGASRNIVTTEGV